MLAGAISAIGVGGLWVLTSWLLRIQIPAVAVVFGGIVSAAVTRFSAGRGIVYQGIASFWTVVGLLVADTVVVLIFWQELYAPSAGTPPPIWNLMEYQALYDPLTFLFYGLGIIGGLWIWRE